MTYRNNNNNNNNRRNNQQGGNFNNNNNYGGTISRGNNNVNPWDGPSMGGGNRGGSSNDALALANNLLNNLLRNQNQGNVPPSLLDMARYDGGYNNSPRGGGGYSNDGGFRVSTVCNFFLENYFYALVTVSMYNGTCLIQIEKSSS